MNTKCVFCGKEIKQYRMGGSLCQSCKVNIHRLMVKLVAVNYKGAKCERCGWAGHPAAFEFHHRNQSEKELQIGKFYDNNWIRLKTELDKCELLCAICHRIHHSKRFDINIIKYAASRRVIIGKDIYLGWLSDNQRKEIEKIINDQREKSKGFFVGKKIVKTCPVCQKDYESIMGIQRKFCSQRCQRKNTAKVTKLSKKELESVLHEYKNNCSAIGRKMGVIVL